MTNLKSIAAPLHKHLFRGLVTLLLPVVTVASAAATIEQETITRLTQIRAIRVVSNSKAIEQYNKQMDDNWQFFSANKTQVLPILRNQLKDELIRPQPSDLLLLDVGFFVHSHDNSDGKEIAKSALFALNPDVAIVRANNKELFEFAHAVAREHDQRTLAFIDHAFLSSDQKVFIPQHALTLDPTLICVYLFGVYGPESEEYLTRFIHENLRNPVKCKNQLRSTPFESNDEHFEVQERNREGKSRWKRAVQGALWMYSDTLLSPGVAAVFESGLFLRS